MANERATDSSTVQFTTVQGTVARGKEEGGRGEDGRMQGVGRERPKKLWQNDLCVCVNVCVM